MSVQVGIPTSDVIKIQIDLETAPAQGENVDTMLIVGSTQNVIDTSQRMRTYESLGAIANDFGSTTPEYLAGSVWFGQSPQPLSLNIGFWAQAATNAVLAGGVLTSTQQLISAWNAITSGGFTVILDSIPYTVSQLSLAAATNLNGVASLLSAALILAGAPAGTMFNWNLNNADFTLRDEGNTPGPTSTVSFLQAEANIGNFHFSGQPAANDTITLGSGNTWTFVSGTPTSLQIQIGGSLAQTVANTLAAFEAYTPYRGNIGFSAVGTSVYMIQLGVIGYTLAKSSSNITVSGSALSGANGGDTNLAPLLEMASTSVAAGAYVVNGIAAESLVSAVTTLDNMYSDQWYGLFCANGQNSDYLAVAAYIEGASVKHYLGVTDQEGVCLSPTDTSSLMYQLQQLGYNRTAVQYSSQSPYAVVSYLARILTTNWGGSMTAITLAFKQEPGVVPETLTVTQLDSILGKNGSVFVKYNNGTAIIRGATSASGQYTDTIVGVDWLAIQCMTDLFNALYTTPTKIPQTDAGMNQLHAVLDQDCAQALTNGVLGPGTWTLPGFGALVTGAYLPKGYYIYQPPVSSQSQADRQARKSVPFQIGLKMGGAVHEADVTMVVNQ